MQHRRRKPLGRGAPQGCWPHHTLGRGTALSLRVTFVTAGGQMVPKQGWQRMKTKPERGQVPALSSLCSKEQMSFDQICAGGNCRVPRSLQWTLATYQCGCHTLTS